MALRNLVLLVGLVSVTSAAFNWCRIFHEGSECVSSCPPGVTPHDQGTASSSLNLCDDGFSCCGVTPGEPVVDPSDQTTSDADVCGLVAGRARRSIGGSAATRCSWPWLVSVRFNSTAFTSSHVMNAVLVSKEHLVVDKNTFDIYKTIPGGKLEAYFGDYFINMDGDEDEKMTIDLANRENIEQSGLMILKLTNAVNVSPCVRPVCTSNTATDLDMSACKMVGWGRRDSGNGELAFAAVPLEQSVTILDKASCMAISSGTDIPFTDNLLCLDMEQGHSTTGDDLGSPIMCPDGVNQWHLQGVLIRANYNETTKLALTPSNALAFNSSWITASVPFK